MATPEVVQASGASASEFLLNYDGDKLFMKYTVTSSNFKYYYKLSDILEALDLTLDNSQYQFTFSKNA